MTYQRNIADPLLPQEDVLDHALPDQIVRVQVDADDKARDEDDGRALEHLRLVRPLDLLQLAPRLGDEPARPTAGCPALTALALRRLRRRPDLSLPRACALDHLRVARVLLLGPPGAALLSRLLGHQRVSRCRVWRPHQRQYLRNSTRSGEFRFDFCVW